MITCAMITMNAGKDIPGSTILYFLKNFHNRFRRILIVDGNLTSEAKEMYSCFKSVEVIDSPWHDSYVDQYRAFVSKLKDGEMCLYLDDDELPSRELMDFLDLCYYETIDNFKKQSGANMFYLPCILHLTEDGKTYFPAEPEPDKKYHGQWTKHILFRNSKDLDFKYFGSHVVPTFGIKEEGVYVERPYFHMKTLESFVENDCWQAFLSPGGQQYSPVHAAQFKLFTSSYKSLQSFKAATRAGTWPEPLKKFSWNSRWLTSNPVSRLSFLYYILLRHEMPELDPNMNWNYIKQFVLSKETMVLYEENKKLGNGIVI